MNLGRIKEPQNLAEWLEIAVGDLVPSAQARVRPEIEGHFAETLQRHREQGPADASALAAALAGLGDARAAARRFACEYLTKAEVRKLGDFDRPRGEVLLRHVALFCILLFAWQALHNHNDLNFRDVGRLYYTGFLYVVMAAALTVIAFRILSAFWPSPVAVARRTLSLRLVLVMLFFILAAATGWLMRPAPWISAAEIAILLAAGFYAFRSLNRLREKLRHAADVDFAIRPSNR